jgi:hypothetical protein
MNIFSMIPNWAFGIGFLLIAIAFMIVVLKYGLKFKGKGLIIDSRRINPDGIILAFEKVLDTQFSILRIEFRTRLKEQMAYTEDRIKEIKEIAIKSHRHLLISKGISATDVHNHSQLKTFDKIIDGLLSRMKDNTRDRFIEMVEIFNNKENRESEYYFVKAEFEQYIERIANNMIQEAREYVSKEWIENEFVTRRESFEAMTPFLSEVAKSIKDILVYGIKVQLKYEREVKCLKVEQKEYIKKVTVC